MSIHQQSAASSERRGTQPAIPANLQSVLTQEQSLTLRKIEDFGWQLAFVRRPLFQPTLVVVLSPDHRQYAVLDDEGRVDRDAEITLRH